MPDKEDQKYRVLLVDDEEVIRDSVGMLLREHGFDAMTASSVDEALSILKKEGDINTIISDIKMPKKDGIELLKTVRKTSPDIPVILLTGYADVETAQKAVTFGAYDYINKPVDEEKKLLEPLNRAIEKNQLAGENKRLMAEIVQMVEEHEALMEDLLNENLSEGDLRKKISSVLNRYDISK